MATLAAPALTWTGSTPPQSFAVVFTNQMNQSHATGYPVITRAHTAGPILGDWVSTPGTVSAFPLS